MQWFGGLVVVVLALLFLGPGLEAKRVSDVEGEPHEYRLTTPVCGLVLTITSGKIHTVDSFLVLSE